MAHSRQPPVTPEKQLASSRLDIYLDSPILDGIDCTPNTKNQMISLKRKASQLPDQGSPNITPFLKWRLAVVESKLRVRAMQKQALLEANIFFDEAGKPKMEFMAVVKEKEKVLLSEKAFLLSQRKILEEDLKDIVTSKVQLEEAYIAELRMLFKAASKFKGEIAGPEGPKVRQEIFLGYYE